VLRRSKGDRGPTRDFLRPLEQECTVLQFDQPLTTDELRAAGELLAGRPDVQLYVYGRAAQDLEFLKHFPGLRRLQLALFELEDVKGLRHVTDTVEDFTFGRTKRTFSLNSLHDMARLRSLFLAGHKKDIAVLRRLERLRRLGLSGITLPDLSLLLPLQRLRTLSVLLGGTRNLALLPQLAGIEELLLMRITRLADVRMVSGITALKMLRLDWMRNVTQLPDFGGLPHLESVTLDTMKGLTDLRPLASAPSLRRLVVTNMPQLTAEMFASLVGHPMLKELWCYTGRARVNAAVKGMFPGLAR
jgi:internalin A